MSLVRRKRNITSMCVCLCVCRWTWQTPGSRKCSRPTCSTWTRRTPTSGRRAARTPSWPRSSGAAPSRKPIAAGNRKCPRRHRKWWRAALRRRVWTQVSLCWSSPSRTRPNSSRPARSPDSCRTLLLSPALEETPPLLCPWGDSSRRVLVQTC